MRPRAALHSPGEPAPWSPRRPGGGAQLAAVELATALAGLGWDVAVFASVDEAADHLGVRYRPLDAFDPAEGLDLLLCWGSPEAVDLDPQAGATALWVYTPEPGPGLTPERAERIDTVVGLSRWHAERLAELCPAGPRVVAVRNGVHAGFFAAAPGPRPRRVAYTSQPERGLDVLLDLWPRVRQEVPDAELVWTYAPVYDWAARSVGWVGRERARIEALARQPGVRGLGPAPRDRVAALLGESRVWAHPSWQTAFDSPFFETSCLAAMEAQAAGAWPVASAWGALPETVEVGALVPADGDLGRDAAAAEAWRDGLVAELVRGLTDDDVARRAQADGPAAARAWTWEASAGALAALAETVPR